MNRNVSVFRCNILISDKIIKEMLDPVASGTHCICYVCIICSTAYVRVLKI